MLNIDIYFIYTANISTNKIIYVVFGWFVFSLCLSCADFYFIFVFFFSSRLFVCLLRFFGFSVFVITSLRAKAFSRPPIKQKYIAFETVLFALPLRGGAMWAQFSSAKISMASQQQQQQQKPNQKRYQLEHLVFT